MGIDFVVSSERVRPNSSFSPRAENNLDVIPIPYVYCSLFKMLQYLVQAYIYMQENMKKGVKKELDWNRNATIFCTMSTIMIQNFDKFRIQQR